MPLPPPTLSKQYSPSTTANILFPAVVGQSNRDKNCRPNMVRKGPFVQAGSPTIPRDLRSTAVLSGNRTCWGGRTSIESIHLLGKSYLGSSSSGSGGSDAGSEMYGPGDVGLGVPGRRPPSNENVTVSGLYGLWAVFFFLLF